MTQLEEEKKLVAEKLMGWDVIKAYPYGEYYMAGQKESISVREWSPQSERKWWDEIWEKMDLDIEGEYHTCLILGLEDLGHKPRGVGWKQYHTAKPSVCWQALIKTLEAK